MTDDREEFAAEYALGTLDQAERAQAVAMTAADPDFAALVRGWELRLGELQAMVAPVEPPAELWQRIKARVVHTQQDARPRLMERPRPRPSGGAEIVDLSRRLRRWQGAAVAAAALAATLSLFIAVREVTRAPAPGGRLVAVLQRDAASPGFLLTVDVATKTFTMRKVGAETPAGRSYELWLVSDKFPAPRSLGLVEGDFTMRPALAKYDAATINGATYAVSLEPPGGSPTGAPTGPVVFTGKLIEAER